MTIGSYLLNYNYYFIYINKFCLQDVLDKILLYVYLNTMYLDKKVCKVWLTF
jgi:hypothetical protein